ncbi:hypothetical protein D1872_224710 [compost metagenome]
MPSFPNFRLLRKPRVPRQNRPGNPPDRLVKRNIHAVEQRADLRRRLSVVRKNFKQPRPVQMQLDALLPAVCRNRFKLPELRQLPADFTLGKLQQQAGDLLPEPGHILQRNQAVPVGQQNRPDAMQLLQSVFLVDLQMTEGMVGNLRELVLITVDSQGYLLRHRAARKKHRRLLAEVGRHLLLKIFNHLALAVHVALHIPVNLLQYRFKHVRISRPVPR